MLLRESLPRPAGWHVRIEETGLCEEMIVCAHAGGYDRIDINRCLPARFAGRYFDRAGEDWIIEPEITAMCNFSQGNLCGPRLPSQAGSSCAQA